VLFYVQQKVSCSFVPPDPSDAIGLIRQMLAKTISEICMHTQLTVDSLLLPGLHYVRMTTGTKLLTSLLLKCSLLLCTVHAY